MTVKLKVMVLGYLLKFHSHTYFVDMHSCAINGGLKRN